MARPIIEVKNLHKSFELKQKAVGFLGSMKSVFSPTITTVDAVKDISFSVEEGELLAFIGPNGAGKSTTIKMLTGILYPTRGSLSVLGFNPSEQRQNLAFHIGSVFGQKPQLWYHLPPQDTYDLLSRIYELDRKAYKERLDFLVDQFEIHNLLQTAVRKLSLGQRMRCEIVAALLHRPKVVFLDEPTIGLDVIAKEKIREVIKYLNQKEKVTIFLTSHDAGDIESLAQRTIVINHGTLVFDNSTENFKKKYVTSKTVELVIEGGTDDFSFPDGKIIEKSKYSLKIELDTTTHSIEKLLSYAVSNHNIKDINIFDPAMEEIIATIYREKKA
jgi:ABC-2 type transport system ATP-binding protein